MSPEFGCLVWPIQIVKGASGIKVLIKKEGLAKKSQEMVDKSMISSILFE
jgi:hypothetical protein